MSLSDSPTEYSVRLTRIFFDSSSRIYVRITVILRVLVYWVSSAFRLFCFVAISLWNTFLSFAAMAIELTLWRTHALVKIYVGVCNHSVSSVMPWNIMTWHFHICKHQTASFTVFMCYTWVPDTISFKAISYLVLKKMILTKRPNWSCDLDQSKNYLFPKVLEAVHEIWSPSAPLLQRTIRLKLLTDGRRTNDDGGGSLPIL